MRVWIRPPRRASRHRSGRARAPRRLGRDPRRDRPARKGPSPVVRRRAHAGVSRRGDGAGSRRRGSERRGGAVQGPAAPAPAARGRRGGASSQAGARAAPVSSALDPDARCRVVARAAVSPSGAASAAREPRHAMDGRGAVATAVAAQTERVAAIRPLRWRGSAARRGPAAPGAARPARPPRRHRHAEGSGAVWGTAPTSPVRAARRAAGRARGTTRAGDGAVGRPQRPHRPAARVAGRSSDRAGRRGRRARHGSAPPRRGDGRHGRAGLGGAAGASPAGRTAAASSPRPGAGHRRFAGSGRACRARGRGELPVDRRPGRGPAQGGHLRRESLCGDRPAGPPPRAAAVGPRSTGRARVAASARNGPPGHSAERSGRAVLSPSGASGGSGRCTGRGTGWAQPVRLEVRGTRRQRLTRGEVSPPPRRAGDGAAERCRRRGVVTAVRSIDRPDRGAACPGCPRAGRRGGGSVGRARAARGGRRRRGIAVAGARARPPDRSRRRPRSAPAAFARPSVHPGPAGRCRCRIDHPRRVGPAGRPAAATGPRGRSGGAVDRLAVAGRGAAARRVDRPGRSSRGCGRTGAAAAVPTATGCARAGTAAPSAAPGGRGLRACRCRPRPAGCGAVPGRGELPRSRGGGRRQARLDQPLSNLALRTIGFAADATTRLRPSCLAA